MSDFGSDEVTVVKAYRVFAVTSPRRQTPCAEHDSGGHIARFFGRDLGVIGRDRRFLRFAPPRARLRVATEAAVTENNERILSGISPVGQRFGLL